MASSVAGRRPRAGFFWQRRSWPVAPFRLNCALRKPAVQQAPAPQTAAALD